MSITLGVIIGIVVLWAIGIGVAVFVMRRQSVVEGRLEELTRGGQAVTTAAKKDEGPRTNILAEGLNRVLAGRGFAESLGRDLARADLKISVGEFYMISALLGLGVGVVIGFLRVDLIAGAISGVLAGIFAPRWYVGFQKGSRLTKFDNQLADMLNLVVNGLRAGYSVTQALEAVSRELPPPISGEFKRVVQEMQLGIPMEAALANLTRRIPSKDLDFVVTAMNVQREVGGNLAEILDTISFTIRERVRIKGEIQTLTAQGMMTGYVISFLPIGLGFFLYLLNPVYMGQFFIPDGFMWCGYGAIVLAILLIVVGFSIVMKIVDIEV
jgi:tight adherence protein B